MALLLLVAQQGWLAHALSHSPAAHAAAERDAGMPSSDAFCERCNAFGHVGVAAIWAPPPAVLLSDLSFQLTGPTHVGTTVAALPAARSRGPPHPA